MMMLCRDKKQTQGDEIRELKKSKPDKATMKLHVDELLALKAQYKEETGKDYAPAPAAAAAPPSAKAKAPKTEFKPKPPKNVRKYLL